MMGAAVTINGALVIPKATDTADRPVGAAADAATPTTVEAALVRPATATVDFARRSCLNLRLILFLMPTSYPHPVF